MTLLRRISTWLGRSAGRRIERSAVVEEVEPRILYSADLNPALWAGGATQASAIVGAVNPDAQPATSPAVAAQLQQRQRHEIVFVDAAVPDAQKLIDSVTSARPVGTVIEFVQLSAGTDGLTQIGEVLANERDLDAIHIISHGAAGQLQLGNTTVDAAALHSRGAELQGWRSALSDEADLMLYGCDVAADGAGRDFVQRLAALTGADVAASDDLTGQRPLGGNWTLEYRVGTVETSTAIGEAAQQDWAHSLAVAIDATSTGTSTGGSLSISHTTAGSNRLMLVGVSINLAGANSVSAMTYNGTSLSLVGTRTDGDARIEIWSLVAPTVGTSNVNITISGTSDGVTAGVMTFTGVDQATPLGSFVSNSGVGGSGSVTVGSAVGELVFGAIAVDDAANYDLIPGQPGQAEHWDLTGGPDINGGGSTRAGAPSVGLSWSWPGSDNWAAGGVSIKPSAGNAAPTITNLSGDTLAYSVGSAATVIEQGSNASVADIDSGNFDTGTLTVSFAAGGVSAQDVLAIRNQGTGAGQIGVSGANVTYAGTTIGTWAGGSGGSNLVITLNANANSTNTSALIQNITYQNTNASVPTMSARTVRFVLTDGDGGTSANHDTTVNVTSSTLAVVTTNLDTAGANDGDTSSIAALNANKGTDGLISLREAIIAANNTLGADTIRFNIAGAGPHTITPLSVLPSISGTVVIDGWSEPDFAGLPIIELNGASIAAGGTNGLSLSNTAGGSTIRGLVINRFTGNGIDITGTGNTIVGNWVGTDVTGTLDSGNGSDGIAVKANNNTIGGTTAAERNVVSGNGGQGVDVDPGVNGTVITGNYIGTNATGSAGIGNSSGGIIVENSSSATIGGAAPGEGNVIAFNTGVGVLLTTNPISGVRILGNSIYSNSGIGIDLGNNGITNNDAAPDSDTGANNLQNFPALTSANAAAAGTTIVGSLTSAYNTTYRIEFFANRPSIADSPNGEGERYLGFVNVTTNGSGVGTVNTTLANVWINAGDGVTATATNLTTNDTSEFGANVTATSTGIVVVDTISDSYDSGIASGSVTIGTLGGNRGADGRISLREAIYAANNTGGVDRIVFNIVGSGVQTINVGAAGLPIITSPVIIDGWSSPNYAGTPVIELNGSGAGANKGLELGAGSSGSTIRGLIINRFTGTGIEISGASNNHVIQGNWIGLNATGTAAAANGVKGIYALNSTGLLIGGTTAAERNVISGNAQQGIYFDNVDNSTISGNYIGTNAAGTGDVNGAVANTAQSGVFLTNGSSGNVIGGTSIGARNILSGNNHFGFEVLFGSQNNLLQGNYIGTDVTGLVALGNINGGAVFWNAGTGNVFGGSVAGARNVIAGNTYSGIVVGSASTGAVIEGNYIGVGADGVMELGNGSSGVRVEGGSTGTRIGTNADGSNDAAERNVISGNTYGVRITDSGSTGTVVAGNIIGLAADGDTVVANSSYGVSVSASAANTTIGGATSVSRNIISGNAGFGVYFDSTTSGNSVLSNYIGTNAAGTAARANLDGVWIDGGDNNTIGQAGAGNLISGNTYYGVVVDGAAASGNVIRANLIGTDAAGTGDLGNGAQGILVSNGASSTSIGGTTAGQGNTIAFNDGDGIHVSSGTGVSILGNAIHSNTDLGIDLDANGVTANDLPANMDSDSGANNLQNFPVLTLARTNGSNQLTLSGTLNSNANSYYRIEFFANTAQDDSGYGEGQTYLGFANVATDGSGNATISTTLTANVAAGTFISATATKSNAGYSAYTDTSEFARNVAAVSSVQATISVDTTSDTFDGDTTSLSTLIANKGADGFISLREAIIAANNTANGAGADRIIFDIAGAGPHTITLSYDGADAGTVPDALPTITGAVIIDGTSEPDFAANGNRPIIVLDGNDLAVDGLVLSSTADGSTIRGLVIRDFGGDGIEIQAGSDNNTIAGNFVGRLDTNGADAGAAEANAGNGILVYGAANTIGGTTADARNVVSGNAGHGIFILNGGATNNVVQGNYVGTDAAGTSAVGNAVHGVVLSGGASNNLIGGTSAEARNVISGNTIAGVRLAVASTSGNTIQGNFIGVDVTGAVALGNGTFGVITDSQNTTIGGTAVGARNVISGNASHGVFVDDEGTGSVIQGNYIGTDVTATLDLGNAGAGVYLNATTNVLIGGGARNVISGNTNAGIYVNAGSGHTIQGNYIGVDVSGAVDLGNDWHGVIVNNAAGNLIGGTSAAERNVISGNAAYGVAIAGASATGNTVSANYIGLNAAGTAAVGNLFGVDIEGGATSNTIGGLTAGARNVISGNTDSGVLIQHAGTSGNQVLGNYIGTNAAGSAAVANLLSGVNIKNGATNNTVGGTVDGAGNLISGNGGPGVVFTTAGTTGNAVLRNSVYGNTGLGIDINGDGVTTNDVGDADAGANDLQNFPLLTSAVTTGTQITITGTFNSTASTTFRIEFFASAAADGSGHGEGQTYLGFANVTTDGSGNATINNTLPANVAAGAFISATATNNTTNDTSEFSQCVAAMLPNSAPTLTATPLNPLFTEAAGLGTQTAAVNLFSGAAASSVESGQTITGLTFTVSGLLDGANEVIVVDGRTITLGGNSSGTTVTNGLAYSSTVSAGTATIVLSGGTLSAAATQTLVNGITYQNTNTDNPSAGNRVVTLTQIKDSGGTSNGGVDTTALAIGSTVAVAALNDAPGITSAATVSVAENQTSAVTVTSTDVDGGAAVYSITGGADQVLFSINASTGVLSFNAAPNFEIPTDAGGNNVYDVTVQVSDGNGGTATQAIAVTVTNVNEAPVITSAATVSVAENQTSAVTVTSTDVDGGAAVYSITGGADQTLFSINASTGVLSFNAAPNFEAPGDAGGNNVYDVTVQVADGNGGTASQSIAITVTNVNEAPVFTSSATVAVAENQTGAITVTSTDVDGGAPSYSITGGADAALFTINATTGALTFNAAPNFEAPADAGGNNVYDVTVQVADGNGGTASQSIAITVTNVNEAPVITSSATVNAAENQTAAITVTSTDVDGGTPSYSITGGADQALFSINSTTGALTFNAAPNFEAPTDTGADNVYDVTVQVADGNGGTASQAIAITVTNVNEAPVITSAATVSLAENQTAAITVTSTDVDGGAPSYSITGGADASFFTINSTTGVLTFNTPPNFEAPGDAGTNNVYDVTVQVADGNGGTASQAIAITVTNVNEAPVITSAATVSLAENQTAAITVTSTDVDGGAPSYSITGGADASLFTINSTTGVLTFNTPPNFEAPGDAGTNNVYDVTVQVADGNGGTASQAIAITVTNVNEAPVITSSGTATVAENQTGAITVTSTDVDGGAPSYSITGGADASLFTINATTGVLTFNAAPNFEAPTDAGGNNVYDVTVQVADGNGGTASQAIAITVTNVNEAPVITSAATVNAAENQTGAITVTSTDVDGGAPSYSITGGADASLFTINATTGVLTFNAAPNFEAPTDAGGNNVYDVTVQVADGNGGTASQAIAITVTNVNEAPVITSAATASVAENQTSAITVTSTDVDGGTAVYSITGGADQTLFSINSSTGVLSFNAAPNFEAPADAGGNNFYDVTVQVSDGNGGTATQAIAVTVTNVNEAPVITSDGGAATAAVNAAENQTAVTTVTSTDVDGGTAVYTITGGADQTLFSINGSTGVLTFNAAPNFEIPTDAGGNNVYDVTVQVADGNGGTASQAIAVTVTNANEAPVITSDGGLATAAVSATENQTAVTTVTSTDVDGGTAVYSIIGGADQALFSINSTTGALTFNAAPNFESPIDAGGNNVYDVTVQVADGNGGTASQAIAITVTNVNEAPVITSSATVSVAESQTSAITVTSTDVDGGAPSYSITGGADASLFTINATTGVLTFNTAPNFEAPTDAGGNNVYDVTVQVADGNGGTASQAIAITVTNVNEAPVITSSATVSVAESQTSAITVTSTDVDGGAPSYSITGGADAALFTINATTGALTFNAAPNFEAPGDAGTNNVYDVTVQVADGNGGTASQAIAITVTNVNEAPVITSAATVNAAENQTGAITVTSTDVDGGAPSYSITGGADASLFTINATTGVLTFNTAPNFEAPTDAGGNNVYDVTVQVADGNGGTASQAIAITVTNVNEAPVITSAATVNAAENQTGAITVTSTDVDGGAPSYSITGGADASLFTINATTGVLTFNAAPNFEAPGDAGTNNVYDVTVQVADGNGGTASQAIAITVTNVNEAPVITSSGTATVAENQTGAITVTSTDVDGGAPSYSVTGGADASLFTINATTGVLTFNAAPNFEAPTDAGGNNVYDVTVQVSDGNGGTATQAIAVTLTNVNEPPVITSAATVNAAENQTGAITVTSTDVDGGAPSYSVTGGADSALFTINATTGVLTFNAAPNFEAPADAGGNNVYDVTVQVADGNGGTASQAIAVTVTNANEAPVITSDGGLATAAVSATENQTAVTTVTSTDVDGGTAVYSIIGGADQALFSINSTTGALTFNAAPNFESPIDAGGNNVYDVTVQVSDGNGGTDTQAIVVTVTSLNDNAPVITSHGGGVTAAVNVAENTAIVTTVSASDADLPTQTLTYSISGGVDAARFAIDASTGVLSFVAAPDHEAPTDAGANNVYDVIVQVSDGTFTDTQAITVTVTSLNDNAPAITSNGGGASAVINVAEDTSVVTTVTAADADLPAQTLTYSISGGADAARFTIDAGTGALRFLAAPDFEAPGDSNADNVYDVVVQVSDGNGGTDTQAIAVTVTNTNSAPTLGNATLAAVSEDSANPAGQSLGALFSGQFADADGGASLAGVAVVANSADAATQGSWQYSSDGGAGWYAIGAVADDATALALSNATLIRFLPARDFNGSPSDLILRGLDDTYAGGFSSTAGAEVRANVDAAVNGGSTPIAATAATLATSITPVNDAPVVAPVTLGAIAADSGGRLITQAELLAQASDIDGPGLMVNGLAIVAGSGNLVDNGDGSWTYSPAAADASAVQFAYSVSDGGVSVPGSALLDIVPNLVQPAPTPPPTPDPQPTPPPPAVQPGPPSERPNFVGTSDPPVAGGTVVASASAVAQLTPAAVQVRAQGDDAQGGESSTSSQRFHLRVRDGGADGYVSVSFDIAALGEVPLEVTASDLNAANGSIAGALRNAMLARRDASIEAAPPEGGLGGEPTRPSTVGEILQDPVRMASATFTAGFVWWLTRSGGLLTTMLMGVPAWRHVDLLPVLATREDDDEDDNDDSTRRRAGRASGAGSPGPDSQGSGFDDSAVAELFAPATPRVPAG